MTNEQAAAEMARFEAEDRAADALLETFKALGRSQAAEAIDQAHEYEDARGSYEQNLLDTITENHKGATEAQTYAAIDAYNEVWNAATTMKRPSIKFYIA